MIPAPEDPAEAQVFLAYRAVLRRDPDADGLATYARALREGRGMAWLVGILAGSDEYRTLEDRLRGTPFALDSAPPMAMDVACGAEGLQAQWDRVARTWSALGETEPHWSVLTEEEFCTGRLDAAALAAFHESGAGEVRRLDAWLLRAGLALRPGTVCAEYGCGVGRITRSLARRCARVVAFDVSAPHLQAAQAQLDADGIGNVELVHVQGSADLSALVGIDLFYSVISLQHSPPPVILDVLGRAFAGLRPGGCAFFQVPTYALDYAYPPPVPPVPGEMEMHFVPQRAVLGLAHRAGLAVAEIQPDWCVGRPGEWISSTFLLVKE